MPPLKTTVTGSIALTLPSGLTIQTEESYLSGRITLDIKTGSEDEAHAALDRFVKEVERTCGPTEKAEDPNRALLRDIDRLVRGPHAYTGEELSEAVYTMISQRMR